MRPDAWYPVKVSQFFPEGVDLLIWEKYKASQANIKCISSRKHNITAQNILLLCLIFLAQSYFKISSRQIRKTDRAERILNLRKQSLALKRRKIYKWKCFKQNSMNKQNPIFPWLPHFFFFKGTNKSSICYRKKRFSQLIAKLTFIRTAWIKAACFVLLSLNFG